MEKSHLRWKMDTKCTVGFIRDVCNDVAVKLVQNFINLMQRVIVKKWGAVISVIAFGFC